MTQKQRFLSILSLIIGSTTFLLAMGFLLFKTMNNVQTSNGKADDIKNPQPLNGSPRSNTALPINSPVQSNEPEKNLEMELQTLSRSFAERFGSYSSNNPYMNLKDLRFFMTKELWKEVSKIMKQPLPSNDYYGVTSRAIHVQTVSLSEAERSGEFRVLLQRKESKAGKGPVIAYQSLRLKMSASGDDWLVSSYQWEPIRQ